jgi:hypothetical protein
MLRCVPGRTDFCPQREHDQAMTATHRVIAEFGSGPKGRTEVDGRPTPEVLGRLRPSAFVGALIAGGLAWFGLVRLAAWLA